MHCVLHVRATMASKCCGVDDIAFFEVSCVKPVCCIEHAMIANTRFSPPLRLDRSTWNSIDGTMGELCQQPEHKMDRRTEVKHVSGPSPMVEKVVHPPPFIEAQSVLGCETTNPTFDQVSFEPDRYPQFAPHQDVKPEHPAYQGFTRRWGGSWYTQQ